MSCVKAWHVSKPQVVVMHGAVTDNNATLFAQGSDSVINPLFKSGKWTAVAHTAGSWDAPTSETEFQAVYTAHPNTNAALIPNDANAAADHHVPAVAPRQAEDLPDHRAGRPADGPAERAVRLPVRHGVQADLPRGAGRGGARPVPAGRGQAARRRWSTARPRTRTANVSVPSVLETPKWVTTKNMNATVVKDNFVPASQLCAGSYAADCTAAGITP